MNVPRHQLDAIRAGATQTVLLPRPHAAVDGQTITLRARGLGNRRGDPDTTRATVITSHVVLLGQLTSGDTQAMGWRSFARFRSDWIRRHEQDRRWDTGFREGLLGDDDAAMRWESHWAQRNGYAVTLAHDPTHLPRLLAKRSEFGYVAVPAQALPDEPEAIR